MKLISSLVAAAIAIAIAAVMPAQAATATAGFNVTATLTSKCEITAGPTAMAFTYTSFQTTAATATSSFSVRCTNTLPFTMAVDTVNSNTLIGLVYTLPLSAAGGTGTGSAIAYSVNGNMAAGQSGTCATTAACSSTANLHTLTVTY